MNLTYVPLWIRQQWGWALEVHIATWRECIENWMVKDASPNLQKGIRKASVCYGENSLPAYEELHGFQNAGGSISHQRF